jgi:hypothetical protein
VCPRYGRHAWGGRGGTHLIPTEIQTPDSTAHSLITMPTKLAASYANSVFISRMEDLPKQWRSLNVCEIYQVVRMAQHTTIW